jgi:hypothetical protein
MTRKYSLSLGIILLVALIVGMGLGYYSLLPEKPRYLTLVPYSTDRINRGSVVTKAQVLTKLRVLDSPLSHIRPEGMYAVENIPISDQLGMRNLSYVRGNYADSAVQFSWQFPRACCGAFKAGDIIALSFNGVMFPAQTYKGEWLTILNICKASATSVNIVIKVPASIASDLPQVKKADDFILPILIARPLP